MKAICNPYEQGWMDAERGKSMSANPYPSGTGEAIAWRWGHAAMYSSIYSPLADEDGTTLTRKQS